MNKEITTLRFKPGLSETEISNSSPDSKVQEVLSILTTISCDS